LRKFPFIWLLLASFVCIFPASVWALNSEVTLYIDGEEQELQHPLLYENQDVYIAIDTAAHLFALEGSYEPAEQKANLVISGTTYHFQESDPATAEGQPLPDKDAQGIVAHNQFYIPLSFVADKLALRMSWDAWTGTASLYEKSEPTRPPKPIFTNDPVTEQELDSKVLGVDQLPFNWRDPAQVTRVSLEGGRLSVQTNSPVEVQPLYLADPGGDHADRLVLDIPHAVLHGEVNGESADSGYDLFVDHPIIRQVRFAQFSQDPLIVRVVLDLKQPVTYQVEAGAQNGFAVSLQSAGSAAYRVVIDAGHGGKDPGATGISHRYEKEFNLNVAKKVQAALAGHPQVSIRLTRDDDTYITLEDRSSMANDWPADLFVSIHANTFERPISGTETYYWNENSKALADLLHASLIDASGFDDRGVRKTAFKVVKETKVPAVLLEIGYLTNAEQEQRLLDNAFQDLIAQTIAEGILEYLNLS